MPHTQGIKCRGPNVLPLSMPQETSYLSKQPEPSASEQKRGRLTILIAHLHKEIL